MWGNICICMRERDCIIFYINTMVFELNKVCLNFKVLQPYALSP